MPKKDRPSDSKESVIKCSLPGRVRDQRLLDSIQDWVLVISHIVNKGSLVFNRMLLHCLDNNIPLPTLNDGPNATLYYRCMNDGKEIKSKEATPQVANTIQTYFKTFPSFPSKPAGSWQAINYAAASYKTNFITSLHTNFQKRQLRYILYWLKDTFQDDYDKALPKYIQNRINNWTTTLNPPEAEQQQILSFIQHNKDILQHEEETRISDFWIKKYPERTVTYFYHILKYLEHHETATKFTLAPISSIKRHFIRIDTAVLHNLLRNIEIIGKSLKLPDFRQHRDIHFQTSFKYKQDGFSYLIDTDGVSACFHYQKTQRLATPKISKRTPARIVGIDPGRTNIVFAAEKTGEDVKTWKLTRKHYYNASGMTKANKKVQGWQSKIKEQEDVFARVSPRTTNPSVWAEYLANYIQVYKELWEAKTQKKYARSKFRVYSLKRKVLDQFLTKIEKGGPEKPHLAYGSAKFSSTGCNELSAPKTSVLKRCMDRFLVRMVDEFRTTKTCSGCGGVLGRVCYRNDEGNLRSVRGLVRCGSNECVQQPLKDRDQNAALNIGSCYEERPTYLLRETNRCKLVLGLTVIIGSVGRGEDCEAPEKVSKQL